MKFIENNFLIIILVGLFFVFALVGYLIDMVRNNKNNDLDETAIDIKPIDIKDIEVVNKSIATETIIPTETDINKDDSDDLLKNYDDNISE